MKKLILIIIVLFAAITYNFAQAPAGFKYQAVARDADNQPYQNENIAVRMSLIRDGVSGVIDYSERHEVTTTDLGVFDLQIGTGDLLNGNFENINWGNHSYYLKVDLDPAGGTDYTHMGVSQLLSVPYALYAKRAGDSGSDADADPQNEIQVLTLNGNQLMLSNGGGSVTLPDFNNDDQHLSLTGTMLTIEGGNSINLSSLINDADPDPTNEIQTLSLNGTQISLSNGGGSINLPTGTTDTDDQHLTLNGTMLSIDDGNAVDLSPLQDGVNDADANPMNELQTISKTGNLVSLSNGGGSFTDETNDADADPQNEIQTLSLNGTQISLSNGGGSINLPSGTTDTDDQHLTLSGTTLSIDDGNSVDLSPLQDGVNDADADPSNEIQTLSLNGTQISLSNGGGSINLPTGTTDTDDQHLTLNGTTLSIDDGNSVDLSPLQDGVNDADADPQNEIQTISLNGTQVTLSNGGGSFNLPAGTTDTDDQHLTFSGTTLSIDDGNSVDLSPLQDGVNDADADPSNEIQTLSLNGTEISLSNGGGSINLPTGTTDTDDQHLTLNGTTLSIDDGNSVDLSPIQDGVNDADANPTNELQTISKTGNTVSLSNGGGSFTDETNDADADPQNELQTISLNGTQVTLSNGGGSFNLPTGTTDTDDQHLTLSGTTLSIDDGNSVDLASLQDGVDDADADPANELQTIHKSGDFIVLTNGGQVEDAVDDADADPSNEIQNLTLTGNSLEISGGNTVDLSGIGASAVWNSNGSGINYNTGKVGIGTDSPISALHIESDFSNEILVKSNGTGNSFLTLQTNDDAFSYLQITQADANNPVTFVDGTPTAGMGIINTGVHSEGMILATNGYKPIKFMTDATARMILDQDGNLGIGTNNPTEMLHIKGTDFPKAIVEATGDDNTPFMTLKTDDGLYSDFGMELGDTSTIASYNDGTPLAGTASLNAGVDTRRLVLNASNGPIHFMSGYETRMFLNNIGQLGLGTTSPEREIHLKGGPARVMLDAFGSNNEAGVRLRRNFDVLGYDYFNFELHPDETLVSFADGTSWSNAAVLDAGLNTARLAINSEGGPLQLLTSGHTRMYFDNNGKAGIGTMSPQSTLHLQGGSVEESLLRLEGSNPWMGFYDNNNLKGYVWYANADNRMVLANKEEGDISFDIGYGTRMTLDSNGDLGIGTNTPDTRLHVVGDVKIDDSTPGLQFFDGNDWHGYFYSDLTDMILGNVHDSDILFQTNALTRGKLGKEGLELHNLSYRLDMKNTNATGPVIGATYSDSPTNMRMATTGLAISPMGTVDAGDYPLRVVESGVYGINLFNGSSESDWELYVSTGGDLSLYADNSFRGTFDGTSGDYTSASDRRLKTNIRSLESTLEKLLKLEPSRYEYIANNPTQKESIGFIAQDVQKLFPELVKKNTNERSEGIFSLNYAGFSVLAVKAIQEQQEIIDNQQQEIDDLKARLDKIEALLNK